MDERPLRVFLCHGSRDKIAVRDLYQRLRSAGVDPWLDEENLLPGQDWRVEIKRAVSEADGVIVCLSRTAVDATGFMQREIAFALDLALASPASAPLIVPLLLEDCLVPEVLRRWHWVEYHHPRGYERLLRGLRARAADLGRSPVEPLQPGD